MSGQTQLLELLKHPARHFDLFLDAIDDDGSGMQVILEGFLGAVFGVRNIVANVRHFRKFAKFDFHKVLILPQVGEDVERV
jgi:hypothetical protein